MCNKFENRNTISNEQNHLHNQKANLHTHACTYLIDLSNAKFSEQAVFSALLAYWGHSQWICGFVFSCRYKGKSYRASVRIVCLAEQVADFCRRVCTRLQCCPNLFGPTLISEKCPENCSIHTKTKYSKC